MRKKALLLAAVMLALPVAATQQPVQEVSAYEIGDDVFGTFEWINTIKKDVYLEHGYSDEEIDCERDVDTSGWKVGICPIDNQTLEGAVAVKSFESVGQLIFEDLEGGGYECTARMDWFNLEADIPAGDYGFVVFDENGVAKTNLEKGDVHKFADTVMFDFNIGKGSAYDGYVYAYANDELPLAGLGADTYPVLLAKDGKTAISSFDSYTTEEKDGALMHVYRLKVLDKAKFELSEGDDLKRTFCMYKVNGGKHTPAFVNSDGIGLGAFEEVAKVEVPEFPIFETAKPDEKPAVDAPKPDGAGVDNKDAAKGNQTMGQKTSPKTGESFWDFLF